MDLTAIEKRPAWLRRRTMQKALLFMKLTTIFFLLSLLQVAAKGLAQPVSYSGRDVPLEKVLEAISRQTGYEVFFKSTVLKESKPVTIKASNMPLAAFLDAVFANQPLQYVIVNKNIIVSRKVPVPGNRFEENDTGQPLVVKGRVTDSAGNALAGANVLIRGSSTSTVTDEQGTFTIAASPGDVLLITYVGFEPATYKVSETNDIIIRLMQIKRLEEEVQVSTGYQRLPRERAAGSFGIINQAALDKRSNYNILTYLEGLVPGVLTAANGQITIRGTSTLSTANRDPLIVLDGFPIERPVESINANDIESITVLKDASAASIWGVRAANGVIVIQTKRGASAVKPLDINFTTTFSVTPHVQLNDMPFAPTSSFIEFEKYKVANDLTFFTGKPRPAISPVVDAYLNNRSQAAQLTAPLQQINAYDEFERLFMHPATRQQYALSLAGKGRNSTFRGSFSYDRLDAEFKNNISRRFTGDLFESIELHPSLRIDMGLNFVQTDRFANGMGFGDITNLLPYQRILDDNGGYVNQPQTFYQPDKEALVKAGYPYNWNYNGMQEFRNKNNKTAGTNINTVAGLSYKINKGLMLLTGYQYESGNTNISNVYNEETYFVRNTVNVSTSIKNNIPVSGIPKGGIYRESINRFYSHTLRGQLKYDGNVGNQMHYVTAIAGAEIREVGNKLTSLTKYGYDAQSLQFARVSYTALYTDVRGAQQLIPDGTGFEDVRNRFVSLFANAGYTYDEKYTLNASARLDKTNLFGSSEKYRNVWLWSAGAAWHLHKEPFFNVPLFNTLTLRATYGINGNVDRSTSPFLVANVATDFQTNQPYAYVANPQNPLLRWEKTTVTNVAMDFSMMKKRLRGSFEYYNRVSDDLLGNSTVNGTYGFNSAFINYAAMKNTGVDIRLSGVLLNKGIKWNATLNYSYNKNKVTRVDFPQNTVGANLTAIPQAGKPLDYLFSYEWAGLDANGAPQVYNEKHVPVNFKTDLTSTAALIYEGTAVPPHYGALINEFGYKGFSLLTSFTYRMGHKFRVPVIQYEPLFDNASQVFADWDNRWKQPGDEQVTNTPAAPTSITGLNVYDKYTKYANINIATASIVRFRELLLNYTCPQQWLKWRSGASLTLGFQIRNLAVYKFNSRKLDPEYLTVDRNNIVLPPRAEYSFIIRANF